MAARSRGNGEFINSPYLAPICDLKPANVMVNEDGRLKVLDFGLATLWGAARDAPDAEPTTREDELVGTYQYMAPEQLEGDPADSRSDVFSLGILLFEMVTGQRPFRGETPTAVMLAIVRDRPPPVAELNPGAPAALGRVIKRCLHKDPEERYQSAGDLCDELKRIREDLVLTSTRSATGRLTGMLGAKTRRAWWVLLTVVAVTVAALLLFRSPPPAQAYLSKIVILPFENLGLPDDAYFAAGITEEITGRLGAVSGLGVISRTTAAQYDRIGKTVPEIGRDLGVEYVLEGTVRWDRGGEDRVVVTLQLITVADDILLWSERYERVLRDIFAVQAEIADQVTRHLGVTLVGQERIDLDAQPTHNLEAYQAYLKGLARTRSFVEPDLRLAVAMFERAIDLDPEFALAHAALSRAHSAMYHYRHDLSSQRLAAARAAADRALKLDPDLPDAHRALGYYYYFGYRDYDSALDELAIVEEARPNDAQLIADIGYILRRQGVWDEAVARQERALDLDPQNHETAVNLAISYRLLRRYEDADRLCDRAIALAPDHPLSYTTKAVNYWLWSAAIDRSRAVLETMPAQGQPVELLLWQFQLSDERRWQDLLDLVESTAVEVAADQIWFFPNSLIKCFCAVQLDDEALARTACTAARTDMERAVAEQPDDPRVHSALGWALALAGDRAAAIRHGELAVTLCPVSRDALEGRAFEMQLARILAWADKPDAAIDRIEVLLSDPSELSVAQLTIDPIWDPLRDHPRFQELLAEGLRRHD